LTDSQDLCDGIVKLGDILACYVIDRDGRALGSNFGELDVDENLRKNYSNIAAQIWGGLSQVEGLGGDIEFVVAKFTNFKILGIPSWFTHRSPGDNSHFHRLGSAQGEDLGVRRWPQEARCKALSGLNLSN